MITTYCNYSIIALEQLQGVQKNVFNTILRVMLWAEFLATHVILGRLGLFGLFWAILGHFGPKKLVFQYSTQNLSNMFFGHPVEASFKAALRS